MKPGECVVLETKEERVSKMKEWSTLSSNAESDSFKG